MAKSKNDNNSNTAKVCNIWTKWSNPLRALNSFEIERMLQNARYGDDVKLQVAFFEIERNSPIFSICISKRQAGVINRQWRITPKEQTSEAKVQAEAVQKMFLEADTHNRDGLTEALKHLVMSSFRGRAAVKPFVVDGKLVLKKLDNWNFMSWNGVQWWNPSSEPTFLASPDVDIHKTLARAGLKELPENEVVAIVDDKPLDWAGISIYLRLLVGEEQWARAVEKFGIPQVLLKTPEGTPESDLQKWDWRAQAIFEGASGVLPSGTSVDILTGARAQDPFTEFIAHQMQIFCILATGSTMATLGGASGSSGTGMGSSVADVQNEQFVSLVNMDCKRIENAMQVAVDKCVYALGQSNSLCKFSFVESDDVDVGEYLDWAMKLQSMGVTLDIQKLKELTKLEFIKDDTKDIWKPLAETQE